MNSKNTFSCFPYGPPLWPGNESNNMELLRASLSVSCTLTKKKRFKKTIRLFSLKPKWNHGGFLENTAQNMVTKHFFVSDKLRWIIEILHLSQSDPIHCVLGESRDILYL